MFRQSDNAQPGAHSWGAVFATVAMFATPIGAALVGAGFVTAGAVVSGIGTGSAAIAAKLP